MIGSEEKNELINFISKKGAVGLLMYINPDGGNIKSELNEKLLVSTKTVGNLLTEAKNIGLVRETNIKPGDHPRSIRYKLTSKGKRLQNMLLGLDAKEHHYNFVFQKRQLEKSKEEVIRMIEDEGLESGHEPADSWEASEEERMKTKGKAKRDLTQESNKNNESVHFHEEEEQE